MKIYLDTNCSAYISQAYAVADYVLRYSKNRLNIIPFWKKKSDLCFIPEKDSCFEMQEEIEIEYDPEPIKIVKFADNLGKIWWTTHFYRVT